MTRAGIAITDGTRENLSFISVNGCGYPKGLGYKLVEYLNGQLSTKHGKERLHKRSALATNLAGRVGYCELEKTFNPFFDTAYFYMINTSARTLSCHWCMSINIPDDQYLRTVENKPRMAKCLNKIFEIPFSATQEDLTKAMEASLRCVKARHEKLTDLRDTKDFIGLVRPLQEYLAEMNR